MWRKLRMAEVATIIIAGMAPPKSCAVTNCAEPAKIIVDIDWPRIPEMPALLTMTP